MLCLRIMREGEREHCVLRRRGGLVCLLLSLVLLHGCVDAYSTVDRFVMHEFHANLVLFVEMTRK